jgi:hypothetical protein
MWIIDGLMGEYRDDLDRDYTKTHAEDDESQRAFEAALRAAG